jgi:hypothetical protein
MCDTIASSSLVQALDDVPEGDERSEIERDSVGASFISCQHAATQAPRSGSVQVRIGHFSLSDSFLDGETATRRLHYLCQIGVDDVVVVEHPRDRCDLLEHIRIRNICRDAGLRLLAIENIAPQCEKLEPIILGREDRDRAIARVQQIREHAPRLAVERCERRADGGTRPLATVPASVTEIAHQEGSDLAAGAAPDIASARQIAHSPSGPATLHAMRPETGSASRSQAAPGQSGTASRRSARTTRWKPPSESSTARHTSGVPSRTTS